MLSRSLLLLSLIMHLFFEGIRKDCWLHSTLLQVKPRQKQILNFLYFVTAIQCSLIFYYTLCRFIRNKVFITSRLTILNSHQWQESANQSAEGSAIFFIIITDSSVWSNSWTRFREVTRCWRSSWDLSQTPLNPLRLLSI